MENKVVLPVTYFGPILYWANLVHQDSVCSQSEPFKKQTFINRCIISGPNKIQTLTVPCTLKEKGQTIVQTEVVYKEKWPLIHVRSLTSAYGKSPYFEYYMPEIASIILSGEQNLGKLNEATLRLMSKFTGIPVTLSENQKTHHAAHLADFEHSKTLEPYHQVFSNRFSFISNLSILDLIFNKGPECREYLLRQLAR